MSHRLRTAMLRAQLDVGGLAAAAGVDVKTVNRWLGGRVPHQRTRLAVARLLGETEADLWPQARPDLAAGAEATAEVIGAWAHRADIPRGLWTSLLLGATDRIDVLGYAYPFVLELLPDTVHLYNAVFRFDNQMIVTPYLYRARGYQHPALHLRELSPHGIFGSFADQFEQVWETADPIGRTR